MSVIINPGQMIPEFNTKTFAQIYPELEYFEADFEELEGFFLDNVDFADLGAIYMLLYSKYGNNPISNLDENQFKVKLFSIIATHGPVWIKRINLQKEIRNITLEDATKGSIAIHNHATNDSTLPNDGAVTELNFVDNQNVSKYKRSKIEAANILWESIKGDVTEDFIRKFRYLFKSIVRAEHTEIYTTVEEEI